MHLSPGTKKLCFRLIFGLFFAFIRGFSGIRTLTFQYTLRYDYEPDECKRLINAVKEKISKAGR